MSEMEEGPLVQGDHASWVEIRTGVQIYSGDAIRTLEWSSIKWDQSREPGVVLAEGDEERGTTVGRKTCTAEGAMTRGAWKRLKSGLYAKNKKIGLVRFDINVNWTPSLDDEDDESQEFSVLLQACRITKVAADNSASSSDASMVTLTFKPKRILEDGIGL